MSHNPSCPLFGRSCNHHCHVLHSAGISKHCICILSCTRSLVVKRRLYLMFALIVHLSHTCNPKCDRIISLSLFLLAASPVRHKKSNNLEDSQGTNVLVMHQVSFAHSAVYLILEWYITPHIFAGVLCAAADGLARYLWKILSDLMRCTIQTSTHQQNTPPFVLCRLFRPVFERPKTTPIISHVNIFGK